MQPDRAPPVPRRRTREVRVGSLILGGEAPVRIQTMWKSPLADRLGDIPLEIERLKALGCELLRFAVPDLASAERLEVVSRTSVLPLVADIHFDPDIALRCLDFVEKIRLNPGNITSTRRKREVLAKAADRGVPIRIGINAGSLPHDLRRIEDRAEAMVVAAERELDLFERHSFSSVVVSLKASDIDSTVRANELFAERYDHPLHLGLTEAGPIIPGLVKSSAALIPLLRRGIGETVRVSLSAPCAEELAAAREILRASGRSRGGVEIISCPRCGRAGFDTHRFLEENREWLATIGSDVSIAIMGCEVNGPGEAKHADVGITGAGGKAIVFRNGKIVARVPVSEGGDLLRSEVEKLCNE